MNLTKTKKIMVEYLIYTCNNDYKRLDKIKILIDSHALVVLLVSIEMVVYKESGEC